MMPSRRAFALSATMFALLLAGCGAHTSFITPQNETATVTGRVHGGQQPVAYSTIVLYTVGTSGDGSTATALYTTATDANGNFTLTGDYSCASATEVYITATGGQASPGVTNSNLQMMAALGSCTALQQTPFIMINELTTVAAVNALAPYITSASAIGSGTSDVAALNAAFTLASEYVNPTTGFAPGASVPTGYTVPVAEIDSLGNAMAVCVNSAGGTANDGGTNCGNFFEDTKPTSSAAPTNTLMALLDLANNPTLSTSALYTMGSTFAQFQPALTMPPTTFALALVPNLLSLQVSPSSITFPSTATSTTGSIVPVTISNNGTLAVTLTSIALSGTNPGDFGAVSECGPSLAVGASCTVAVTPTPTSTGSRSASLVVTSSAIGSPQSVGLSVTGIAGATGALVPASSAYYWYTAKTLQDITVTNTGTLPISFTAATGTSYFSYKGNTCSGTIPALSTCTLTVESTGFADSGPGPTVYTDTLTITDTATNGPQTISLNSTNNQEVSTAPSFGSVSVGSSGSSVLDIGAVYPGEGLGGYITFGGLDSADFNDFDSTATQNGYGQLGGGYCSTNLYGCGGNITFTPTAAGTRTAKIYINPGAGPGSPSYINVSGTAPATTSPAFSAGTPVFANAYLYSGVANTTGTVTITNNENATLNPTSYTITEGSVGSQVFAVTGNNCASLAPLSTCTVNLSFTGGTQAPKTYYATLGITDSVSGQTVSVNLTLPVEYTNLVVSPYALNFNNQTVGSTGTQTVTVTDQYGNPPNYAVRATLVQSGSFYTISPSTNPTCAASSTVACTFTVSFIPTSVADEQAFISITDQNGVKTQTAIDGKGYATTPLVLLSATTIGFPTTNRYNASSANVTLTNGGSSALTLSSVSVSGATNNNFYVTSNTCTGSIASLGTCSFSVVFAPTVTGSQSATVNIVSNAPSSPNSISLSGTAQ